MSNEQFSKWDAADTLESEEDMLLYLNVAMEDPFAALIEAVLGDIARAKGAACIAEVSFDDARLRKAVEDAVRLIPDSTPA